MSLQIGVDVTAIHNAVGRENLTDSDDTVLGWARKEKLLQNRLDNFAIGGLAN